MFWDHTNVILSFVCYTLRKLFSVQQLTTEKRIHINSCVHAQGFIVYLHFMFPDLLVTLTHRFVNLPLIRHFRPPLWQPPCEGERECVCLRTNRFISVKKLKLSSKFLRVRLFSKNNRSCWMALGVDQEEEKVAEMTCSGGMTEYLMNEWMEIYIWCIKTSTQKIACSQRQDTHSA